MQLTDQETIVLQQLMRFTRDEGLTIPIERLLPGFQRRNWHLNDLTEAIVALERKSLVQCTNKNSIGITEAGIAAVKSL